jgi:hypothetical protein
MFSDSRHCNSWNKKHAGNVAGSVRPNGRRKVFFGKKHISCYRIIYEMVKGSIGKGLFIDHINGNPLDDRVENLRIATRAQNMMNMRPQNKKSTPLKGVTKRAEGKWYAYIRVNNRSVYLGTFTTDKEAHCAYCEAAKKHFGEFARTE